MFYSKEINTLINAKLRYFKVHLLMCACISVSCSVEL